MKNMLKILLMVMSVGHVRLVENGQAILNIDNLFYIYLLTTYLKQINIVLVKSGLSPKRTIIKRLPSMQLNEIKVAVGDSDHNRNLKKMSGMIQVRLKYQISKLLNDRIMVVESSCLSRGLKKRCVSKKYLHTFLFFTLISAKIVIIITAVSFKYFRKLHFVRF